MNPTLLVSGLIAILAGLLLTPWRETASNYFGFRSRWGAWGLIVGGLILVMRAMVG